MVTPSLPFRCGARARLGTVARRPCADRPLHRQRRQRPLPGYGVSRSRVFRGANRWKSTMSLSVRHREPNFTVGSHRDFECDYGSREHDWEIGNHDADRFRSKWSVVNDAEGIVDGEKNLLLLTVRFSPQSPTSLSLWWTFRSQRSS